MRIAQIIPGIGINCGGPSRSVLSMTEGLRNLGVYTDIITNNDLSDPMISTEPWIRAIEYKKNRFGYNRTFAKELENAAYDLFHIHSVFSYSTTIAMRIAERRSLPFIVSPRGSLLKSALSISSKGLKNAFNKLILFPDLKNAVVLHATSHEEMLDMRSLGVTRPTAIIPNSIIIPKKEKRTIEPVFRVGVCGRINPIKNIDGIIRAWSKVGFGKGEMELIIIGGAKTEKEKQYLDELRRLEKELTITNIVWAGPIYGNELQDLLNHLTVLVLGSHSENFGMVVPEALAQQIPVIASSGTPWRVLNQTESGWWVDNSDYSIANTLTSVYQLFINNKNRLLQMGENGYKLVEETYSQESVAKQWQSVYEWVLNGGEKPEFVLN